MWWISSSTSCHIIGIFVTAMRLMTTIISGMHCPQLNIRGWMIGGSVGCLLSFYPYQRLMHFWFYNSLSTAGYVGREFLRYWTFVRSWHGKLLTIYALVNGGGGLSSCHTTFIGWWMHQGTQEYIRIGVGCALQKLPINIPSTALNAGKL